MDITMELNISAHDFYQQLMTSVLHDIYKQTNQRLRPNQLTNFNYVKQFGTKNRAKMIILHAIDNQAYAFKTETLNNTFTGSYILTPLADDRCRVVYTETMTSIGTVQKINDAILGTILAPLKKRRFKQMLQMMENSVSNI